MKKFCGTLLIGFVVLGLKAQEVVLPTDFRQQNLTEYNGSIVNPAYSLDRNNPSSIAFWSRWQWQTYDGDPTSLFLNYTARLNDVSAAGIGFFQHNTGIFLNTGANLNYAYNIALGEDIFLGVGLNVFAFQQKLADDRFFVPNPIQTSAENDFILQMAPGINLSIDRFNIGLTSENLFDYNFTTNERNTSPDDRMFQALVSYDFPLSVLSSDNSSVFRPMLYYKTIPGLDNQIGLITLLTTNKYWAQAGYNSFYGFSGGIGGRFFKRLSFGALVEVGTSSDLKGQDPTFELVTSYKLGKQQTPAEELEEQLIAEEKNKEELLGQQEEIEVASTELTKAEKLALKRESKKQERLALIESKRLKDSIQNASRQSDLAVKQSKRDIKRKRDSLENAKAEQALAEAKALQQQRQKDSIAAVMKREAEAVALAQQRRQDSIAESKALAMRNEVVEVKAGEKYEEVTKEGSLEPGYYLIANVFGTKKYLDAFLADMKKRGINAKSFFREKNKYNYVYLAKFDFIKAARQARDSKLNGKYTDKIWIFRVTGGE
ncbi:type IX secretion system membrane protein, PorP/SprF family [Maribacter dokdonensis]|uniref:Type IX secretion system membrane protein, PorP/SprF family n=1 Tax=Maribacter dokdonensis TaxID=320912 RepID=A0A1H4T0U0_9FLAO|nr:PorP/SprF family type IX secretion system membrane protein [Maribacter dokdonensis]SEC49794.1 type IX secretion system membrane protein, PorP/SprF family [Maribacter dokdonensis]